MKQDATITFGQGVDNKPDPWQLPMGKFESLVNSVFQKGGLLQKRDGYGPLTSLSNSQTYITTLNNNLLAIGNTVSAYSASLNKWVTKGTLQPCTLSVMPLIRNNVNQTQADSVISNGLVCTTFTQTNSINTGIVTQYMFAIADSVTGQNIVPPTAIPVLTSGAISGSSRVFVIGSFFVIVSQVTVTGVTFLQYVSIPTVNPVNTVTNAPLISAAQNVTGEAYVPITSNPGWDGITINNSSNNVLVIAYNTTVGGQGVHVATLTQPQVSVNAASTIIRSFTGATFIGAKVSVCVDATASNNVFYISFWNNGTSNGYTAAVTIGLGLINLQFAPVQIITSQAVANLASAAQNNSCLVFSETTNAYSYDSAIPTNFISGITVSSAGTIGTQYVVQRSAGLASKAFIVNGKIYFLSSYQSPFQPTYYLINGSTSTAANPVIVSQLANLNGGGYVSLGLCNVTVTGSSAQMCYFYKDLVEALNTVNNTQQTAAGGIYSQVGINLVSFSLGTQNICTSQAAQNLMISGGYLGQFDGYLPVENNFFVWPDSVEAVYTEVSTVTPTGTFLISSPTVTVSSATGIFPGMTIADTTNPSYFTAGTQILYVSGTTLTISSPTLHAGTADTLSIKGNIADIPTGGVQNTINYAYQATYEWTDNQGLIYRSQPSVPVFVTTTGTTSTGIATINVPTLRLTAKTANPAKIVIYRWSEFTQVYNQVTSIIAPVLNSTTTDSITFVDTLPDSQVVGNNILYTTGGVVPDTCAPSTSIMTQFDTRIWSVNAEDPNSLWVSKTLIENTPVEMSNYFTIFVAPAIGVKESTGGITALAPMDDRIIIFKSDAIYYINGTGPNNIGSTASGCSLGNYSQPTFITSVVGCTNQQSIVLTSAGLMFSSDKGIWILNRDMSTSYIGSPVENFNSFTVNSANIIPGSNRVLFTLNTNVMLMYDYFYQQWGYFEGPYPVSSCIYQNLHTLLDKYGNILQETPGVYLDNANPVLMSFKTSWFQLAGLQGYQRFAEFLLLGRFLSPHSLQVQVAYDYNSSPTHQKIITPKNYSSPTPGPFGVPTPFAAPGDREQWRVHAKKQLCESFQLTINEVFNPAYGTNPGAGFTMSGITCLIDVKKSTKPINSNNAVGLK